MNHWRNTSDSLSEGTSRLRGYRSRYQAFLQQKTQKPAAKIHHQIEKMSNFGQSIVNAAIFVGLFIAILTLFGFGLSQLKPGQAQQNRDFQAEQTTVAGAPAGQLPAKPAVRAEAKKRARK